ncbi:cadherin 11, isoform CRA_a [Rattus norvegicus]|uniref:Cadherin 11, isoform CRA_a n=1 Tax=Rattus norvegicus TaxID=10116 RepID=A6JXX9_RAT|nr:cadherin 11, isoform CRA_a [Rattus norvegicus]
MGLGLGPGPGHRCAHPVPGTADQEVASTRKGPRNYCALAL